MAAANIIGSSPRFVQRVAGAAATLANDVVKPARAAAVAADPSAASAVVEARRGVRALEQYRELRTILAKDRSAVDVEDLRRLAAFQADMLGPVHGPMQLPSPQRQSFGMLSHYPERRWDIDQELDALRAWSDGIDDSGRLMDAEHARMLADPSVTRASLTAEVRSIVARPLAEITPDQLRRLATIETLPGRLRPGLPKPNRFSVELIVANGLETQHWQAANELRRIRVWAEQRAIMADRSLTGDVLRREALAIAAKAPDDVTLEDVTRLAAIQGVSDARGVGMPGPYSRSRIGGLAYAAEQGWAPRHRPEAAHEFDAVRIWREQVLLDADPSVAKSALDRELLDIAIRPRSDIGTSELRRIAAMDGMRGPARPSIPPAEDARDFRWLAVSGNTPHWSFPAQVEIAKLRPRQVVLSDLGLDVIRHRVARGGALDSAVLSMLAGAGEATVARAGMTIDDLRRLSTDALARAGKTSRGDVLAHLREVRAELVQDTGDHGTAVAALRARSMDLIDRNIARVLGERADTYSRHPDYAEVGRVVSNVELLRTVRSSPGAAPPSAGSIAEALSW